MMTNAEKFIDIYNQLDAFLTSKRNDGDKYVDYSKKVRESNDPLIKKNLDKLLSYGKLRNAISHTPRGKNEQIIAQPNDEAIIDFELLYHKILNPQKVIPNFQFKVEGTTEEETIDRILKVMKDRSFSQFPVFDKDGYVIELINTNTISRWLADNIINGEIVIESPKAKDLLGSIEFEKNYKFISRNCDIYTAYQYFIDQIEKTKRNLDVLFITENGEEKEKPLGLITIEDIANIVSTR
ncbi:CBS domain-containing protein [Myroides profundi]|uniref:CBS domain-containing protein n=1 Tax=Myroides profundi TaxID=480520 RepID=A0AAJ4W456_MYRPR|nr:CBS domain-containing protein [Myroides profundi]AJH14520.1 hypothetical protein MPR_1338 [Myroides profundi]SEQ93982.1 hypothetical protein SAMN04488089_107170 [Myroides profundi]